MAMGATYRSDAVPFITAVERAFGAFGADGQFVKGHHDRAKTYLRGFTKVGHAQAPGQHFLTVIEALRELAGLQPGWDLSVKDDYVYYSRTSVSSITNPARDSKQADGTA